MNGWERQREILRLAEENGYVRVDYLAKRLHISESSIRRDLLTLEANGEIRRTYGGAEPTRGGADAPGREKGGRRERRAGSARPTGGGRRGGGGW